MQCRSRAMIARRHGASRIQDDALVAFFARFLFHSLVVYAPRRRGQSGEPKPDTATLRIIRAIDEEAMRPGEL